MHVDNVTPAATKKRREMAARSLRPTGVVAKFLRGRGGGGGEGWRSEGAWRTSYWGVDDFFAVAVVLDTGQNT